MTAASAAPRSLGIIHTVAGLVPVFEKLVAEHLPGWKPFNIVDESLLRNTIKAGELSKATIRRFTGYAWSAADAGAEAILVTCSSLGPAVDAAEPLSPVPLVRVDIGMADQALEYGSRIGVLATLPTTLAPTAALVRRRAAAKGVSIELAEHLCTGAFDLLAAGDRAGHDARIVEGAAALAGRVDVIILAQASMAQALAGTNGLTVPAISSPELGVRYLAKAVAA